MVFTGMTFLLAFLPAVLLLYYLVPRFLKNGVLLCFSLLFYAWGEPVYVLLMILSILFSYWMGLLIHKGEGEEGKRKLFLILSVVFHIGILFFFKYADFLIQTVNHLTGLSIPAMNLPLPIGISFYTFQTLSYVIDVYKGTCKVQKNPFTLATYVSLFPQLIAGPIVRYETVEDQMNGRKESPALFISGVKRFTVGFAKKVLLANPAGEIFTSLSAQSAADMTVAGAWLCVIAFAFQIYFDFSGYSDMAIGLGKMFGFEFEENFNYPYISNSITDFWRRWHISLSTWFRDYVYIPLGGNRKGKPRQAFNILLVWMLTGLWHGASWNYVLWGLYFGVILLLEKFVLRRFLEKAPSIICHIYALFLILIGWAIFAFEDGGRLLFMGKALFGMAGLPLVDGATLFLLYNNLALFVLLALASLPWGTKIHHGLEKRWPKVYGSWLLPAGICVVLLVSMAFLAGSSFNPFLYFRF